MAIASTKATTMATARPRIASRVVVTIAGQRLERSSHVDSSTSRGAGRTVREASSARTATSQITISSTTTRTGGHSLWRETIRL